MNSVNSLFCCRMETAIVRKLLGIWWDFLYGLFVLCSLYNVDWLSNAMKGADLHIWCAYFYMDLVIVVDPLFSLLARFVNIRLDVLRMNFRLLVKDLLASLIDLVCCTPLILLTWMITGHNRHFVDSVVIYRYIGMIRMARLLTPGRIAMSRETQDSLDLAERRLNDPMYDAYCKEKEALSWVDEFQKRL